MLLISSDELKCHNFSFLLQAELAADACGEDFTVQSFTVESLLACLRAGVPAIVAYDRDPNTHLPCLQRGTSAHWGAIRGAAWLKTNTPANTPIRSSNSTATENARDASANHNDTMLVLVGHTMSAHPFVCSFAELLASNAQLHTAKKDNGPWLVPSDGPDLKGLLMPMKPNQTP